MAPLGVLVEAVVFVFFSTCKPVRQTKKPPATGSKVFRGGDGQRGGRGVDESRSTGGDGWGENFSFFFFFFFFFFFSKGFCFQFVCCLGCLGDCKLMFFLFFPWTFASFSFVRRSWFACFCAEILEFLSKGCPGFIHIFAPAMLFFLPWYSYDCSLIFLKCFFFRWVSFFRRFLVIFQTVGVDLSTKDSFSGGASLQLGLIR